MSQLSNCVSLGIHRGKVVGFNDVKGYGFIRPDGGISPEDDVFVHFTAIVSAAPRRSLQPGQLVEFEMVRDARKKKPIAHDVRVVTPA